MMNSFTGPSGDSFLIVPVIHVVRVSGKFRVPVARDGGDRAGGIEYPFSIARLYPDREYYWRCSELRTVEYRLLCIKSVFLPVGRQEVSGNLQQKESVALQYLPVPP
ncbi:hypothetical protein AKJ52_02645 [candidate division MSBL1 archaeon SCGC-AAA382C18]|uniref:Uncharacterized protein n=1 Tax=candidate division MSBL1 archaeon SCGC-AAA382C18 TaxID=1698281 RepID=A0A133VHY5_9EURY|nr:hypothetical protein AKJ52_02645 [candidate division MSBL1 archaeon SCGC-AAA382C18]